MGRKVFASQKSSTIRLKYQVVRGRGWWISFPIKRWNIKCDGDTWCFAALVKTFLFTNSFYLLQTSARWTAGAAVDSGCFRGWKVMLKQFAVVVVLRLMITSVEMLLNAFILISNCLLNLNLCFSELIAIGLIATTKRECYQFGSIYLCLSIKPNSHDDLAHKYWSNEISCSLSKKQLLNLEEDIPSLLITVGGNPNWHLLAQAVESTA